MHTCSPREPRNRILKIEKKRKFKLNIILSQYRCGLNLLPTIFSLLRPVVTEFDKEGAHVRVQWEYRGLLELTDKVIERDVSLSIILQEGSINWRELFVADRDSGDRG
jgi:hypothetical protein